MKAYRIHGATASNDSHMAYTLLTVNITTTALPTLRPCNCSRIIRFLRN